MTKWRCPSVKSTRCPPIQVLDAYNTIANGGVFVEPKLVRGYVVRQWRDEGHAAERDASRRCSPSGRRRR